jgi:drug/metabolite transporter (DMT)-like permease
MRSNSRLGWIALAGSILAISWSPIFVRLADVGPQASAFWRMVFALPVLWAWSRLEDTPGSTEPAKARGIGFVAIAGLLFAVDLLFFHAALAHTSVTNAVFVGNLASVFAVLGGFVLFRERVSGALWAALALALAGAWVMSGARGVTLSFGDTLALAAAVAYAGYVLAVKDAARQLGAARVMLWSSLLTAVLLFIVALASEDRVLPGSAQGWLAVAALGVVSHAAGQGMNAVALRHLPVAPISLVFLAQPILTTIFAMIVLQETLTSLQLVGAAMILTALFTIRPR